MNATTSRYQAIGFDLDGTLINTLPDLTLVVNSMFMDAGLPIVPQQQVLNWIGKGADVLFQHALAHTGRVLDASQQQMMRMRFDHYYAQHVCTESQLYPNVKETLIQLKNAGFKLAVITNKPTHLVQPVLSAFGLFELFDLTLGGQSLPQMKPHPAPLLHAISQFNLTPAQFLFVGDSENDILAAKAAGCDSVGLTYGYNYNKPIQDASPTFVADNFTALLTILAQ